MKSPKKEVKKETKKTEQQKVDERRAEVLARGRQFKYPLQWTKYRVVVNTVLITAVLVGILIVSGWLALYRFGMTDDMLYRVTKIFPTPVATVDGEVVKFSDYLMFYRSAITSIERQIGQYDTPNDYEVLRLQYKRSALNEAESYAYATKLAAESGITVTKEEIAEEFARHLGIGGVDRSEQSFMKIVEDNFGLNREEYDRLLMLTILKSKVEANIDTGANDLASRVESMLAANGNDYQAVATALGSQVVYEETGGFVPTQNIDGGRASAAFRLEPGQSSGKFVSLNGDGYYFVKLIKKTDTEVNFVSIKVPFTEFDKRMENLRENNQITEFVTITDNA